MAKKSMDKLFIYRSDAFDIDFANYQFDDRFERVRQLMSDRRFTVGETDVDYRVINHWDQSGLLPEGVKKGDGGWRKFTLPELVWLRVICRLRDFGLSLDKIAHAKDEVMDWHQKKEKYPHFEYYIARAWASEADPYVFIFSDGAAGVASAEEIENSRMNGNFDILLISLKSVLEEMGLNTVEADRLFSLSEKEIELLSEIRIQRSNEVKAKMNADGDITEIESTSITPKPIPSHEIQNQAKEDGMYGSVMTQYEDGVPKSVRVTKRKKFKK